jgi:hypothetical protein
VAVSSVYEHGSFEILSPLLVFRPLTADQLRIRFAPFANLKFTSRVDVFCHDCPNLRVVLSLYWDSVAPSITLSQESLDFGHVVVGHSVSRSVQVKANATFALEYVYNLQ